MLTPHAYTDAFRRLVLDRIQEPLVGYDQIHEAIARTILADHPAAGSDNELHGKLFEVFVEAMLATETAIRPTHILHPGDVAHPRFREVQHRLGTNITTDNGIDALMIDQAGRILSVQAKFKTNRSETVTYGDTSKPLDQSLRADHVYIVTSGASVDVRKKASMRRGRHDIVGDHLDALKPDRLTEIATFVREGGRVPRPSRIPLRPHQERALADMTEAFKTHDRAVYVSACGTGKTIASLDIAREVVGPDGGDIVVHVPSLKLADQWLAKIEQQNADRAAVSAHVVCSDDEISGFSRSSEDDEIVDDPRRELIPSSTDADAVAAVLARPRKLGELRFTVATYQSGAVLSEAALKAGTVFDFAILDEAHRTAQGGSRKALAESYYGFALDDKRLPTLYRMSMTATPRVRRLRSGSGTSDGDTDLDVRSMDDQTVYGPIAHRYKFGDAARDGIIVPFKIIVQTVLQQDLDAVQATPAGRMLSPEDGFRVAALLAGIKAADGRKILSFHSRTDRSRAFAGVMGDILGDGWNTAHVDGKMGAKERDAAIGILEADKKALLSNVKVMTEGVDPPGIDMVAFLDPKYSKVDIVQAVGRAMRTADGKEHGHVLLPLAITRKPGQSYADAIEDTDFEVIWNVVAALMNEDDEFERLMNDTRRGGESAERAKEGLRKRLEVLGLGKGERDNLSEVDVVDIDTARDRIITKVLERVTSSFGARLEALKAFLEANEGREPKDLRERELGTTYGNEDAKYTETQLATWVTKRRQDWKEGKLSPEHVVALEKIGIVLALKIRNKQFQKDIEALEGFLKAKGREPITRRNDLDPAYSDVGYTETQLARRLALRREQWKSERLSEENQQALLSIGIGKTREESDLRRYAKATEKKTAETEATPPSPQSIEIPKPTTEVRIPHRSNGINMEVLRNRVMARKATDADPSPGQDQEREPEGYGP